MESNEIRLASIIYESLSNGPGLRRVLFSQGCKHNCKNCFNPQTHSFEGGELYDMNEIVQDIISNPMLRGVTFSGGDPLEQADKFAYIANKVKENGKNVWVYTGYTFEYILENLMDRQGWKELIAYTDVLVDGRFEEDKQDMELMYRGSSNQRLIDVQESLKTGEIIILVT